MPGVSRRASSIAPAGTAYEFPAVDPLLTAIVAALLSGTVVFLLLRAQKAALAERIRGRDVENARLTAELASLRSEATRLATLHAEAMIQLQTERSAHERLTNEF